MNERGSFLGGSGVCCGVGVDLMVALTGKDYLLRRLNTECGQRAQCATIAAKTV